MDRARALARFWNWLPPFRVVAETEHLPTAARIMGLSTSALSRAIGQLEQALDRRLFARVGRRLALQPAGRALLVAVRDAMRRIDDGVEQVEPNRVPRVLVAGEGVWVGLIAAPALAGLNIELQHVELGDSSIHEALLSGAIDLALIETPIVTDDLSVERLGTVVHAICSLEERLVTCAVCTSRPTGWQEEIGLPISFRSARLDAVIAACRSKGVGTMLPIAVARPHGLRVRGRSEGTVSQLYLVRRPPQPTSSVEAYVPAIRTRGKKVLARTAR